MSATYVIHNEHHHCILAVFVSSIWSNFVTGAKYLHINVIFVILIQLAHPQISCLLVQYLKARVSTPCYLIWTPVVLYLTMWTPVVCLLTLECTSTSCWVVGILSIGGLFQVCQLLVVILVPDQLYILHGEIFVVGAAYMNLPLRFC